MNLEDIYKFLNKLSFQNRKYNIIFGIDETDFHSLNRYRTSDYIFISIQNITFFRNHLYLSSPNRYFERFYYFPKIISPCKSLLTIKTGIQRYPRKQLYHVTSNTLNPDTFPKIIKVTLVIRFQKWIYSLIYTVCLVYYDSNISNKNLHFYCTFIIHYF